jgi:hypothetical protein
MPLSRELANKKNDHKDRQSRGRANSTPTDMKKGASIDCMHCNAVYMNCE